MVCNHAGFSDELYTEAGASVVTDRAGMLAAADIVLRVRKPAMEEVSGLKKGAIHVSYPIHITKQSW